MLPLLFKTLLADEGLDLKQVVMLRHKPGGLFDPFTVWQAEQPVFVDHQSVQLRRNRSRFSSSDLGGIRGGSWCEDAFSWAYIEPSLAAL